MEGSPSDSTVGPTLVDPCPADTPWVDGARAWGHRREHWSTSVGSTVDSYGPLPREYSKAYIGQLYYKSVQLEFKLVYSETVDSLAAKTHLLIAIEIPPSVGHSI